MDHLVKNPLLLELTIDRVVSSAGVNGTVYAKFDHTFAKPVTVGAMKTVNSGRVPNVLLVQGPSGKHEGHLWASLGSLERPKDFKDTETTHLSGDRYIFFQRHGHL